MTHRRAVAPLLAAGLLLSLSSCADGEVRRSAAVAPPAASPAWLQEAAPLCREFSVAKDAVYAPALSDGVLTMSEYTAAEAALAPRVVDLDGALGALSHGDADEEDLQAYRAYVAYGDNTDQLLSTLAAFGSDRLFAQQLATSAAEFDTAPQVLALKAAGADEACLAR